MGCHGLSQPLLGLLGGDSFFPSSACRHPSSSIPFILSMIYLKELHKHRSPQARPVSYNNSLVCSSYNSCMDGVTSDLTLRTLGMQ